MGQGRPGQGKEGAKGSRSGGGRGAAPSDRRSGSAPGGRDRRERDPRPAKDDRPSTPTLGGGRAGPPAHRLVAGAHWPAVPDDVRAEELDAEIRQQDLRTLSADNAEWVARHLVMLGRTFDTDPELAWRHAQAAVSRAGRVPSVREAAGLAAYRVGEYAKALTELRAARRMSGSDLQLPVIADCERGLGRAAKALEIAGSPEAAKLPTAQRIEMRIVAAGARLDQGQPGAAIVTLQCPELSRADAAWAPRLRYAYAEALLADGRRDEAVEWFGKAAQVDTEGATDAEERWAELQGVVPDPTSGDVTMVDEAIDDGTIAWTED